MRIAIVDDLDTERTLLKERLVRQLSQRGADAEILEFDSGEAFLAAEEAQRFTAAFLDIYMDGLSGMDAAKELRKTDADCLLVFTTTSTDHALEGFQVRAFHYLVKPFSEAELSGLLDEMLAKLPRPEPVLTVKVDGSDIHLRYRDIISAEHFAHIINIRTTAGKTLATRQSFKAFTEPLKKDPRFFVCGRGAIINMENAADFQAAAFCMTDGSRVYVSQELLKAARQAFMEFLLQRGRADWQSSHKTVFAKVPTMGKKKRDFGHAFSFASSSSRGMYPSPSYLIWMCCTRFPLDLSGAST